MTPFTYTLSYAAIKSQLLFLLRDAMHSALYAVVRCLSVRASRSCTVSMHWPCDTDSHNLMWFIHLRAQRPMKGRWAPRPRSFRNMALLYLYLYLVPTHWESLRHSPKPQAGL